MDEKLKSILSKQFSIPVTDINEETDIIKDLSADSIDIIEIIMHIEKAYKIKINENEYQDRSTVAKLIELIMLKTT